MISQDRTLPLIQPRYKQSLESDLQERCWKSLLIGSESPDSENEWAIVEQHFKQSRSNKVLSILQEKNGP